VITNEAFRWDLLAGAFALNLLYMALAFAAFLYAFGLARKRGQLLQSSE
jgi:ABC-2 type transport system permease protein